MSKTTITQKIAAKWYNSLASGDIEAALSCLADDIEWINMRPINGVSDILPWIGSTQGKDNVIKAYGTYMAVAEVTNYKLLGLVVQGNQAVGRTYEAGRIKATDRQFEIDFATWLRVDTLKGKITQWKSFTDPSPIIAAFRGLEIPKMEVPEPKFPEED